MKWKSYLSKASAFLSTICWTISAEASSISIPGGSVTSLSEAPTASEFTEVFKGFKSIGVAVSGICTLTALIFFVMNLTKLSTSVGNDMQRSRALKGILFSGISLALFGGITTVVSIFWNAI